jgi:hypothetical protein
MRILPSRRFPTQYGSDTGVSYVADNESDAEALRQQMGGLVDIRQRVVEEVPYGPPVACQTFQSSRRLLRQNVSGVHRKRL